MFLPPLFIPALDFSASSATVSVDSAEPKYANQGQLEPPPASLLSKREPSIASGSRSSGLVVVVAVLVEVRKPSAKGTRGGAEMSSVDKSDVLVGECRFGKWQRAVAVTSRDVKVGKECVGVFVLFVPLKVSALQTAVTDRSRMTNGSV